MRVLTFHVQVDLERELLPPHLALLHDNLTDFCKPLQELGYIRANMFIDYGVYRKP